MARPRYASLSLLLAFVPAACEQAAPPAGGVDDWFGAEYPRAAFMTRWNAWADENGEIPDGALLRAKAQRDALVADVDTESATGGVDPSSWRFMGPHRWAGRVRAIYVAPNNPDLILCGSSTGGIWRTTDGGTTWRAVDDFLPTLSISSFAAHPGDPGVIYAGTGEVFGPFYKMRGAGIFKSTDYGRTWGHLSPTQFPEFNYVNELAISPGDRRIVLAATTRGIYRTTDAGVSWPRTVSGPASADDVKFHPTDPNIAVASTPSALYYSSDSGASWSPASVPFTPFGRVELAFARSERATVYASVFAGTARNSVFRSIDGGRTYSPFSAFNFFGNGGWYYNCIWVDPTNSQSILVGGFGLNRTQNAGSSWRDINGGWMHSDFHVVVSHPNYDGESNRTVFVGSDGGLFRIDDVMAASPDVANLNRGLQITQFYGGAVAADGRPLGGTQDRGVLMARTPSGSDDWSQLQGFDGCHCAADPVDPLWVYGTSQLGDCFRSNDGGRSIQRIDPPNPGPFVTPIRLDPNDSRRFFCGTNNLMVTDDVKSAGLPVWRALTPWTDPGKFVTDMAVAKGNSNVIYLVYDQREVWRTTTGTTTSPAWHRLDGLPGRTVNTLAVDPRAPHRIYAGLGGFAGGNVRIKEGPNGWTTLGESSLPFVPVMALAIHPRNHGWIYAGTEIGLFVSTDDGRSWSASNEGPANVAIDHLVFSDDETLWAFTHGRGVFRAHAGVREDPLGGMFRASVDSREIEGDDESNAPTITADTRYVAFASRAQNLVPGDRNRLPDVFVRDTRAGTTELVSVPIPENEGDGESSQPCIAHDGRYVAFTSAASNLVPGDGNRVRDVFVRDLRDHRTTRVSVGGVDNEATDQSLNPSISRTGRYVVFTSKASNLVIGDGNDQPDVFLRDRIYDTTVRVSVIGRDGDGDGSSTNTSRAVAANGRYVVFESTSTNLVGGDTNNATDVFLRDVADETTARISVNDAGEQANGASSAPRISADGRFVVFESSANNLDPADTNGVPDIFVHDVEQGTTRLVSLAASGVPGNGPSLAGVISPDGRYVSFYSGATNLVADDTNLELDVFLRDLTQDRTLRVSLDASNREANGASSFSDLATSGGAVAFQSRASNLVPGDRNAKEDVFVARPGFQHFVLPEQRATAEGNRAEGLFDQPSGRLQMAHRESQGRAMTISRIAFRPDGVLDLGEAYPRRVEVEVVVGPTLIDRLTPDFDTNWSGSAVTVRSRRPLQLPDVRNIAPAQPAFDIAVPFDVPYVHDGSDHLLVEIRLFASDVQGEYPIDAHAENRTEHSTSEVLSSGCTVRGSEFQHTFVYSSSGPATSLDVTTASAPPNTPVFLVIGRADPDLDLGFCANLRSSAEIAVLAGVTNGQGVSEAGWQLSGWRPGLLGAEFYTQFAAVDATNAAVVLSDARKVTFPTRAPGPLGRSVVAPDPGMSSGTVQEYAPVIRLDR